MTSHGLRCLLGAGIAAFVAVGLSMPALAADGDVELNGTLQVSRSDSFKDKSSKLHYTLKTKRRAIPLQAGGTAAKRLRRAKPGSTIEVTGDRNDKGLAVDKTKVRGAPSASAAASPSGGRTLAVVLVKFDNSEPFNPDTVRNVVFGSVNRYYSEQTGDTVKFRGIDRADGDIFGAYKVPKKDPSNPGLSCPSDYWGNQAEAQAAAQNGPLSRYDHVMFIFPTQSCGWAGMAGVGWGRSWINGYVDLRVIGHELGHNLGVSHANTYRCKQGSKTVSIGGSCTSSEYGDPFDIMGSSTRHFNGWNKGRLASLGIFPSMTTQTITSSGTYTLSPTAPGSGGTQAIRIRRAGSGEAEYLYLESRKPFGMYDSGNIGWNPFDGVSVRLAKAYGTNSWVVDDTQLLDATPATNGFGDAPLVPGATFEDPESNITITNVGKDANYNYTLAIQTSGNGQAVTPPKSLKGSSNLETISLNWDEIPRGDGAKYNIYRDGVKMESDYPYRTWWDEDVEPKRDYQYWVTAVDEGVESAPSNKITVRLYENGGNPPNEPPTGGGNAPTVSFESPANGASISGTIKINANGSDDGGVKRMELYVDGKLSVKRNASSLTRNLSVKPGRHTITVKAFDARVGGNEGSATVAVTKL